MVEPRADADLVHEDEGRKHHHKNGREKEFTGWRAPFNKYHQVKTRNDKQQAVGGMHLHKKEIQGAKGDDDERDEFDHVHNREKAAN